MTREKAASLLPIIQAFAEGKTIQYKHPLRGWMDIEDAQFCHDVTDYRIKPEPREWTLAVAEGHPLHPDGFVAGEVGKKSKLASDWRLVRVREIID